MKVKQELAVLLDRNNAAHRESESTGNRAPTSPDDEAERPEGSRRWCAGIARAGITTIVGLLLERFHLSGFLFYNAEFLPTPSVDQRWATQDAARRSTARTHGRLLAGKGRLPPRSWRTGVGIAGFAPEEQRLFLNFMQSCRMAFEIRSSDGRWNMCPRQRCPKRAFKPNGKLRIIAAY
jgi:hypothetical protein